MRVAGRVRPMGSVADHFAHGRAGGGLVDEVLAGGERGDQGLQGKVVDRPGTAARGRVDQREGVLGEQLVRAPGDLQMVGDVAGRLGTQDQAKAALPRGEYPSGRTRTRLVRWRPIRGKARSGGLATSCPGFSVADTGGVAG